MVDEDTCQHGDVPSHCPTCWRTTRIPRPMPPWVRDLYRHVRDQHPAPHQEKRR